MKIKEFDRNCGIGGSDVAAAVGVSRYKTPYKLWLEKLGQSEPFSGNMLTRIGTYMEDFVAQEFLKEFKQDVSLLKIDSPKFNKDYSFMYASIDRLVVDKNGNNVAILECKTSSSYNKKDYGEFLSDKMPIEYICQCAHYSMIYEIDTVYLAVLFRDSGELRILKYTRDSELEKYLIEKLTKFWECVKSATPPALNTQDIPSAFPLALHQKSVISSDEVESLVKKLSSIKEEELRIKGEKELIKSKIQEFMKDAELLKNESGEILCTWKNQVSNRFDTTLFKQDHSDMYKSYIKQISTRVFK